MIKKNSLLSSSIIVLVSAVLLFTFSLNSPSVFALQAEQEKPESLEETQAQEKASPEGETAVEEEEAQLFRVYVRTNQNFFYQGDPIRLDVTLANDSSETLKNPVDPPFAKSFVLIDEEGKQFKPEIPEDTPKEVNPSTMVPQYYYGMLIDVTKFFPALSTTGRYKLQWKSGDIESAEININVIQRYDPEKEYYAIVDTDMGKFRLDFFKDEAPLAVKAFIDLSNGGFYDEQIFYQVKPTDYVMAGDTRGDGTGTSGLLFLSEFNDIPVVTGTVLMPQHIGAPPRNDGKFLITLRPRPEKTGFLTVFAQVSEGLEIIKKISIVPTTEDVHSPYFKPLKDLLIKKIAIFEKSEE
jgi:cyclophilin family peptidyl-prolyl cis-trans isomerase